MEYIVSTPSRGIVQPGFDKIPLNLFSRFFARDVNVFVSIGEVHLVDASGKEHCFYTGHHPASEFTFSNENINLTKVNQKLAFHCNDETIYIVLAGCIDLLTGSTVVDVEIESQTDVKVLGYVLYMGEKNKETKIMHTQDSIFERAKQLTLDAESIGVTIKLNMPTTAEVERYKTKRFLTVSALDTNKVLMDPVPNVTGVRYVNTNS